MMPVHASPQAALATATELDSEPLSRADADAVREDLRAALATLEEARGEFNIWLGATQRAERAEAAAAPNEVAPTRQATPRADPLPRRSDAEAVHHPSQPQPLPPRVAYLAAPPPFATARPAAPPLRQVDAMGAIERADAEARAYLEEAKRRVDGLVRTMLGSVEEQAWALRQEAEAGIRGRWNQVESEASTYLGAARHHADHLVEERRARIAGLSDSITARAERISSHMEDADAVKSQFERLVAALSIAADRVAREIDAHSRPNWDRPGV